MLTLFSRNLLPLAGETGCGWSTGYFLVSPLRDRVSEGTALGCVASWQEFRQEGLGELITSV